MYMYFIALATGVVSVALSFWIPIAAWLLLGTLAAWLAYTLAHAKRRIRVDPVPDLSRRANELLSRHAHYYLYPASGQGYASASATIVAFSFVVGGVLAIRGSWSEGLPALALWLVGGYLIGGFKPLLRLDEDKKAHNDIIHYFHTPPFHSGPNTGDLDDQTRKAGVQVVPCGDCGQKMRIPRERERLRVTCPKCGGKTIV